MFFNKVPIVRSQLTGEVRARRSLLENKERTLFRNLAENNGEEKEYSRNGYSLVFGISILILMAAVCPTIVLLVKKGVILGNQVKLEETRSTSLNLVSNNSRNIARTNPEKNQM